MNTDVDTWWIQTWTHGGYRHRHMVDTDINDPDSGAKKALGGYLRDIEFRLPEIGMLHFRAFILLLRKPAR